MARNTSWRLIEKILSGTATAREQRAFQRWLQEDARHPPIFEELQQACNRLPQRFDPLLAYEKLQGELVPTRNRPRRGWRYTSVAATLVLLLIAGGLFYGYRTEIINQLHPVAYCSVSVSPGSRQQVQLADGTKIYLNAGSQLRYPTRFSPNRRQVFLEGRRVLRGDPGPCPAFSHPERWFDHPSDRHKLQPASVSRGCRPPGYGSQRNGTGFSFNHRPADGIAAGAAGGLFCERAGIDQSKRTGCFCL